MNIKLNWLTLDYTDAGVPATVLLDGEVVVIEKVPGYQAADRVAFTGDGVSTIDQLLGRTNGVIVRAFSVGAGASVGDICYLDGAGEMNQADAVAEAKASGLLGICLAIDTGVGFFLLGGVWETTGLTIGARYYISDTAGAITDTAPSGSGQFVRVVGVAISATELKFHPSADYVELV